MSALNNTVMCLVNPALCQVAPEISNFVSGNNNNNRAAVAQFTGEIILAVLIILIIQVLPIVLIAVHCNPQNPFAFGLLAFLFPGVYLFQHAIRKYALSERGYCGNK